MLSIITGVGRSGNLLWALVACAGLLTAACDKLPLLAPQSSTIKLSSASTVVQTNGTTEIRATVLEPSGTPVQNGTTVTFTTNLGTVSPVDARTLNGVATVQFLGNGQSGKAQVRAISGGAASDPLELSVGAAAAGRVVVTANPNQVAPGSPSIITATVTDANSNPLSGVLVSFSTDNGSLSSSISSTSSNGQAQTTLVTSRDATVTATVGTGTATTPGTVKVTVATVPEIAITTSTTSPTEGQPVTFAIAVTGTGSTESFQSIVVDFGDGTTSGPLSGGSQSVAHTYARPGTYVVEATGTSPSGNTKRATTTVSVADRGIVDVRITRSPDVVTQDEPVTFTAAVTGGGTVRSYNWNFGDGRTFNGSSQVSHTYTSTGPRTVTVTVSTTDGNTGRGQTQFVVQP